MSKLKPHELKNLVVEEVSNVNAGANPGARVVLLKQKSECDNMSESKERVGMLVSLAKLLGIGKAEGNKLIIESEELDMADDAITKQLQSTVEAQQATIAKLEARDTVRSEVGKALAQIQTAKSVDEVDTIVTTAKSAGTTVKTQKSLDADFDQFLKSEMNDVLDGAATARKAELQKGKTSEDVKRYRDKLPEAMQKAFDEMDAETQTRLAKSMTGGQESDPVATALTKALETIDQQGATLAQLQKSHEIAAVKSELQDIQHVVADFDQFAENVIKLRKADKGAADSMIEGYRSMAKQMKTSNLFSVVGKSGSGATSAEAKLDAAVAKHMASNPNVSKAQAEAAVLDADPELYNEYLSEKSA